METKHTPGSWSANQERHFWVVEDSEGQRLASLLESECVFTDGIEHDDAAANAKLMSAAPELLEALIESRQVVAMALKTGAPDWFDTDEKVALHVTVQRIDAAIAKATA